MKFALLAILLVSLAACDRPKPVATAPPPAPLTPAPFVSARSRFLESLSEYDRHAWDLEGAARRKALVNLTDSAKALASAEGRPADLPEAALVRATTRVTSEASKFSQIMNGVESRGGTPDSGLPWPYDYKEAASLVRCLLAEPHPGSADKRDAFARVAALLAEYEILMGPPEDAGLSETRSRLFKYANGLWADRKDLGHAEKDDLNQVTTAFQKDRLPTPERIRDLRLRLYERTVQRMEPASEDLPEDKKWFFVNSIAWLEEAISLWLKRDAASDKDRARFFAGAVEALERAVRIAARALERSDLTNEEREVFRRVADLMHSFAAGKEAERGPTNEVELLESLRRLSGEK